MFALRVCLALLLLSACSQSSPPPTAGEASSPGSVTPSSPPPATTAPSGSAYEPLALDARRPAPTCAQAVQTTDVALLVAAYRAARLAGRGAKECLTSQAEALFTDDACDATALDSAPGPVVLYQCGGRRVRAIPVGSIEVARTNPRDVQMVVVLAPLKGERQSPLLSLPEHLTIGPGRPLGGSASAKQVITQVSS